MDLEDAVAAALGSSTPPPARPADWDGGELLLRARAQERTSGRTHQCCHAARVVFLFSHGACVLAVSAALGDLAQASWWLLFSPVWVGDALCGALLVSAWFASCPYIRLCLDEAQIRVRNHPSILTEVVPEILFAVLGLAFIVLAFSGEYALCAYLSSSQRGRPGGLATATFLLALAGVLAACHGALLRHNSPLHLLGGGGLLLTALLFAATRGADPSAQAVAVVPAALVAAGLAATALQRLRRHFRVLGREERALRAAEVAVLASLAAEAGCLASKVAAARFAEAGAEGSALGGCLCLLALLRAWLCWWEARRGALEERLVERAAEPCVRLAGVGSVARELQIESMRASLAASSVN